jgi:tetratricopeptide (TPR) repeat protein
MTAASPVTPAAATGSPRVSLCLIVKDEESRLPTCLRSAADLVDEIIVVDTGSVDRTAEIAREFGARVVSFPWIDDFSAARNESLRHATGKWIFWLDADDYLDEEARQRLRTLFSGLGDENAAWLMKSLSLLDPRTGAAGLVEHVRLFRNHLDIRWQYPVHEQILPAIMRQGGTLQRTDMVIRHSGYQDAEQLHRKTQRNLAILQKYQAEHQDDPFILFCLGWTLHALSQIAESLPLLRRSLELGGSSAATAPKAYSLLVQGHRRLEQNQQALAVCKEGRTHHPDDPELLNQEALLLHAKGNLAGAEKCLLHLLERGGQTSPALGVDTGLFGYRTRYKLGVIYRAREKPAEAEAQWQAALAERPEHTPAWIALADLWLEQGRLVELDNAATRLEHHPSLSEPAALLRSTWYQAQNRFVAARRLLESKLAAHPQSVWLRLALSAALLLEGKDLQTAERLLLEVREMDPDNEDAREGLAELQRQKYDPRRKRR